MCVLKRKPSGDGCDLASTSCEYDLRKGDLFVELREGAPSEAGSISSALLICGRGVRSIVLLPLVYMAHVYCSECVGICGNVAPYRYLFPTIYLSVADIANPVGPHHRFVQTTCNSLQWLGAGGVDTICKATYQTAVTASPCVFCVVWSLMINSPC